MGWKIGWGISNQCNMACKFCYSRKIRKEQPDFANNIRAGLDFIKKNALFIESVNFGTGEPTVIEGFFDCCAHLKEVAPHISIGLTTNGHLAKSIQNPHAFAVFRDCIDDVDVSLDYGYADLQNKSRNHPEAFQWAIETLRVCQQHKKNATVVTVAHRYNADINNMESILRIARLFDASFRVNILRPTVDFEYALPYTGLKELFLHLIHKYQIESIADPLLASLIQVPCPAGDPTAKSSFRILPNGYVTPSTYLLDANWQSLRIDELTSLSQLSAYPCFKQIVDVELPPECVDCSLVEACHGGVIDRRWLWYQNLQERDPYCPVRHGDSLVWLANGESPTISPDRKSFVHDGYLPTLIFKPAVNSRAETQWDSIYRDSTEQYSSQIPATFIRDAEQHFREGTKSILDLGSGLGRNGLYFLQKGYAVTFVDHAHVANDRLLENLLHQLPPLHYRIYESDIADYLHERPRDTLYDAVIATHILSHGTVEEIRRKFIEEIFQSLHDFGILVVTLPSVMDIRCPDQNAYDVSYQLVEGPESGIIHSFFSEESVRALLRGFELLYIEQEATGSGSVHWNIIARKSRI